MCITRTTEQTASRKWPGIAQCIVKSLTVPTLLLFMHYPLFPSKLAQDNRMESPIPILPLSTPDLETEKLIKMKDEEVQHALNCLIIIIINNNNNIYDNS